LFTDVLLHALSKWGLMHPHYVLFVVGVDHVGCHRTMAEARVSLDRLDRFFHLPEIEPDAITQLFSESTSSSDPCSSPSQASTVALAPSLSPSLSRPLLASPTESLSPASEALSGAASAVVSGPARAVSESAMLVPAICMRNVSCRWAAAGAPYFANLSVDIAPGSLVGIVGSVGSGKSSLLSAMLGEMHKVSGSVVTNGRVAYMSQESWIRNTSLRDNILFGAPFDAQRYAQVVEAAALTPDLRILPGGDACEIGERGVNLSGGQKARVQLARALYRIPHAEIFLLDDPFSAVDMNVGHHLFDQAVCGMLRDKTRVVVLNSHLHFLPAFDHIIVLQDQDIHGDVQLRDRIPAQVQADKHKLQGHQSVVAGSGTYAEMAARFPELMQVTDENVSEHHVSSTAALASSSASSASSLALASDGSHAVSIAGSSSQAVASPTSPSAADTDASNVRQPASCGTGATADPAPMVRQTSQSSGAATCSTAAAVKAPESGGVSRGALIQAEDRVTGDVALSTYAAYFDAATNGRCGVLLLAVVVGCFMLGQAARLGCDVYLSTFWASPTVGPTHTQSFWMIVYGCLVGGTVAMALTSSRLSHFFRMPIPRDALVRLS
jgi:ABC-type Mn2+/Zn2+ transport system ATPase subunit